MKGYICFVYETTNKITGKKYIGSHIGAESDICFGSGLALTRDIKKYGVENFSRITLEKALTIAELPGLESKWLHSVDAKNNTTYYNKTNIAGIGYNKVVTDKDRGTCPVCNVNPVAVNYKSNDKIRYRSMCGSCIAKGKSIKPIPPPWYKAGYRKKNKCEKCGFLSKLVNKQITVFHVDGNLKNTDTFNLKSICLNCQVEVLNSNVKWKPSPLTPDF